MKWFKKLFFDDAIDYTDIKKHAPAKIVKSPKKTELDNYETLKDGTVLCFSGDYDSVFLNGVLQQEGEHADYVKHRKGLLLKYAEAGDRVTVLSKGIHIFNQDL